MKKTAAFLGLLLWSFSVLAQNQANIWYFGQNVGLDFNWVDLNGQPTVLSDGAMSTEEGCAVISDEDGNLLFYTNGVDVWNRQHQLMPNGTGLDGHKSSTQAALIVPQPSSDRYFYIFTTYYQGWEKGLNYSVVDMKAAGGLGDVLKKNIQLYTPTTEKLTAVHHANGRDVWVITHRWESDEFYVYLVTEGGLQETPFISKVGSVHEDKNKNRSVHGWEAQGQMKVSPSGKSIALTTHTTRRVEIFNFSNKTGAISLNHGFQVEIDTARAVDLYGIEFSPNGRYLYVSEEGSEFFKGKKLHQYDIASRRITAIDTIYIGASLQLAVDKKVYCSDYSLKELLVIERPNLPADHPDFTITRLPISPGVNGGGLPSFIQSYFYTDLPDPEVALPNVITPNGDEYNERFIPKVFSNVMYFSLQIYNRWGKEIFYTDNTKDNWWDGEGHPSGVYYWHLKYEGLNGTTGVKKGWVQIVR
jgi:gliding motility-associated-like protein